ncbi:DUF3180 domain-containing protein [Austwickia chelonae]|uniref:DUF3180 domain-containing protein n=1 Tax=Austwickia chelonae TaxID=100225 RepID=UPI0011601F00|nr:DUF3180 domain-containing protein [Austwickia chelonae]
MTSGPAGRPSSRDEDGGLRPRTVWWAFMLALGVGYLLQGYLNDHVGRMPFPGWPGAVMLAVVATGLVFAGLPIRRWQKGRRERRLDPIFAFRVLIMARAAALAGGVVSGWYLGHTAVLLPDSASSTVLGGIWRCLAYVFTGGALIFCGFLVQGWCRVDRPDGLGDSDEDDLASR